MAFPSGSKACGALFLLALLAAPVHADQGPPSLRAAVDELVAQVSAGPGREVPGSRRSRAIVLDGRHLQATTFDLSGLHGGNGGGTVLALYESTDVGERSQGGGTMDRVRLVAFAWVAHRNWRTLDTAALRVEDDRILIPGLARRSSDPSCCPSEPIEARYALVNDNLVAD